jgi:predicted AAA+ superfamily ATPase
MKRDPLEIMKEILKAIENEHGNALSLNAIAEKTGIHNITVRRYVQIIEMIRREPEIEIIRTKRSVIVRIRKEHASR